MKKHFFTTTLTATLLLVSVAVLAQGIGIQALPGSGWTSGQQIQNVGTDLANMVANVYYGGNEYGTTGVTMTDIPVNASVNILENHWDSPDTSFQGAAIVSADQPIVAIVNVTNGEAAGQYQGVGTPDTEVGFPLFKNDFGAAHKHTTFYIQNASDTAAMIYASFAADSGIEYTINSSANIEPGEMWVLDPDDVAGMPTGIKGGLVVTSTVDIAGVVLEHGVTESTILQATKGFSPAEYGTELVAPIIKFRFGGNARSTGMQVQNVSSAPVDIYVNYVEAGLSANPGTTYRQWALAVDPGASFTFYENLMDGGDTVPNGVLASATVTATGEIAAIVNETYPVIPAGKRQTQTTYHAIATADATTKVGVPLAKEMMGSAGNEKSTGIQVMNVGSATATNVDLEYSFGGSTYTIEDQVIAAGASSTFFRVNASIPASEWTGGNVLPTGGFGGVVVTSDQPIVVIVQETHLLATNPQDNKNFEGFNLTP